MISEIINKINLYFYKILIKLLEDEESYSRLTIDHHIKDWHNKITTLKVINIELPFWIKN